jgi:hypothetical protein
MIGIIIEIFYSTFLSLSSICNWRQVKRDFTTLV